MGDSEREGEYLSREHVEGGSFVWQMYVDMGLLRLLTVVVVVVVVEVG